LSWHGSGARSGRLGDVGERPQRNPEAEHVDRRTAT
jgi:hypothetical protein